MATFLSRYPELKIVLIPMHKTQAATGFGSMNNGEHVQFHNGYYETKNKDIINFLRQYNEAIVTEVPDETPENPLPKKTRKLITGARSSINGSIKDDAQN